MDLRKKHPSPLLVQSFLPRADAEWVTAEEAIGPYAVAALEVLAMAVFPHSQQIRERMVGLAMPVGHSPLVLRVDLGMPVGRSPLVLRADLGRVVYRSLQEPMADPAKDVYHNLVLMDFCHNLPDLRYRNQVVALFDPDRPSPLP